MAFLDTVIETVFFPENKSKKNMGTFVSVLKKNIEAKENTTFREEEEFSKNMVSKTLFENNFQKQEPNNGPLFDISIQTHKTLKENGEHLWFHFQFFFFLDSFHIKLNWSYLCFQKTKTKQSLT